MTLANGTRLGPYEILAPLGAGGIGEVYTARDTHLDRLKASILYLGGMGGASRPVCMRRKGTHPGGVAALALIEKRSIEITGGTPPGCASFLFDKPVVSLALNHRLIAAKPPACLIVVNRACGSPCGMPVSSNCTPGSVET